MLYVLLHTGPETDDGAAPGVPWIDGIIDVAGPFHDAAEAQHYAERLGWAGRHLIVAMRRPGTDQGNAHAATESACRYAATMLRRCGVEQRQTLVAIEQALEAVADAFEGMDADTLAYRQCVAGNHADCHPDRCPDSYEAYHR